MKARHRRSTGGVNQAAEDLKDKPQRYNQSRVEDEAEERKRGGRAKKKYAGKVEGAECKPRADRKPRKDGGRTGADKTPFSSARKGTPPAGHKVEDMD